MFSVIMPIYNDWTTVRTAIMNIQESALIANIQVEIILVDNGSDYVGIDSTEFNNVKLLNCATPGSYAARNVGIKHALGDFLIFTDSDCIPDSSWIVNIHEFYKCKLNSDCLLAGNVVIQPENSNNISLTEAYDMCLGLSQERYVKKGHAVTANLTIPKVVFDKLGSFDESRFSGGDIDICVRATKAGFKVKYNADAIVYHPARKVISEYTKKTSRIIGARLRRVSFFGKVFLGARCFLSVPLDLTRIILSKKSLIISVKAFLFSFVVLVISIFYFFYHLLPFSVAQR